MRNYDDAIQCYDRVLIFNPSFHYAYNNKGIAFIKSNQFEKAIDCFEKALEQEPSSTQFHFNKCLTYYQSNNFDEMLKASNQAFGYTLDPLFLNISGCAYVGNNDLLKAMKYFSRAIDMAPDYKDARMNRIITINMIQSIDWFEISKN